MDENLLVLHQLADHLSQQNDTTTAAQIEQQAQDVRQRAQLLRQALRRRDQPSEDQPGEPGQRS
jgi:hypothetical protein